jgi:hypothetical protein
MKFFLSLYLFCFFHSFIATAQQPSEKGMKRAYDRILRKVEKNLHENYYTDSLQTAKYNEYTFNDSTKQLLKVIDLEYFPVSPWDADAAYYEKQHHFDRKPSRSYYLTAKLYDTHPGTDYERTFPTGKNALYIDITTVHSQLEALVINNKERRTAAQNNSKKDFPATNFSTAYTVNKFIYTRGKETTVYHVADTLYNNEICYKLSRTRYIPTMYGEQERKKFEQDLLAGYKEYTQEEKDELKYYVAYWANGLAIARCDYIIRKADYAVLHARHYETVSNHAGKRMVVNHVNDCYEKGDNNKYHQVYYTKFTLNFVRGMAFYNNRHIATWMVQKPLNKPYSLTDRKTYPKKIYLSYEDFCEVVPFPDGEMLEEWNKYINNPRSSYTWNFSYF